MPERHQREIGRRDFLKFLGAGVAATVYTNLASLFDSAQGQEKALHASTGYLTVEQGRDTNVIVILAEGPYWSVEEHRGKNRYLWTDKPSYPYKDKPFVGHHEPGI